MKLQTKINYFFLISSTFLVAIIIIAGLISFRYQSLNTAQNHAKHVAESVRIALTESMLNQTIANRKSYIDRMSAGIEGLISIRITRSEHINKQYKQGLESENVVDDIDKLVLSTGQSEFVVEDETSEPVLRSTIPYIATDIGTPNCLTCHKVSNGDVLGTITIRTSIADLKRNSVTTIVTIAGVVSVFALLALFFFKHLLKPLLTTAKDLQVAVENAKNGSFDERIKQRTNDEIGSIALDFNALLDYLNVGLTHINKSVSLLINCNFSSGNDTLANTINMIDGLANASKFKQSIEEDETKEEVYQRLGRIIEESFKVDKFSIYEVNSNPKPKMTAMLVDGVVNGGCKWCDEQILIRPNACRAKRTGHIISSIDTPDICNFFKGDEEHNNYICFPIIQAGTIGSVVQIVSNRDNSAHHQGLIPFIQPYLREASPVIETKRLMATLKESNLKDAMTGLNNRRFLEEYVDTMVANAERTKKSISILMLDLDYFKKVNDTYGHDVGDKVLVTLSKVLLNSVRTSDMVIRYGGEEFLIILQNTTKEYGIEIAEKIRLAVEEMQIQIQTVTLKKTISIGIADFPDDSDTFWQAIKYADVALYQAKEQGRNRAIHFETEMWSSEGDY